MRGYRRARLFGKSSGGEHDYRPPNLFWKTTSVFVILSQLLLCDSAMAQVNNPSIIQVSVAPSGACAANLPLQLLVPNGVLYSCQAGTWGVAGGPGSGAVTSVFGRTGAVTANTGDYTAAKVTNALDLSNVAAQTMQGGLIMASGQSINVGIIRDTGGTAAAGIANNGKWSFAASSALSIPTSLWTGSPIATGGSGTTTWPMILMQPTGTTTTTWSTAGTYLGINAASSFTGNIFDFQFNGTSRLSLSGGGTLFMQTLNAVLLHTFTNCLSAASPAVCAAAPSGSVAVAAGSNPTLQVNTTAVTANSQILLTEDESLSTRLSVTCQSAALPTSTVITARSAGASFTFQVNGTFTTNPVCYSYTIIN